MCRLAPNGTSRKLDTLTDRELRKPCRIDQ
jgi:hypothetical protein